MSKQKLYMETTEVPAERTAGEIVARLVEAGARNIMQDYDRSQIVGVCFTMVIRDQVFAYKLPVQVEPVYRLLLSRRKGWVSEKDKARDHDRSKRIAWRQVLRWVEAQLALIQLKMVRADEVFFPYMQAPNGQTMYQLFVERGLKCLPAPEDMT